MNTLSLENPDLAQSFIRKLIYFDVFSHPLLAEELFEFCDFSGIDKTEGMNVLEVLKARKLINCESGFYFIGDDHEKVAKRMEANKLASLRLRDARKYASIAANFPFVRAVFISGTLSKHVMKPESDIDFFIITEPGKLWLCRALLTLYKKVVLGGSHRNFCLNYFIDSNNLEIPDKNIFTATELVTILPMYNFSLYRHFMGRNNWVRAEFPNFKFHPEENDIRTGTTKKVLEYLFDNRFGNSLDRLCFSIILGFWKRKFRHMNEKSFSLNFRSQINVSKHHPNAFQERVVNKYAEKIIAFEQSTGFQITPSGEYKIAQ